MNNTSAYANVLLKTSTAAPVVARQDFQERESSTDFHQTLKNVHDAQHGKIDKVSAAANHKPTPKRDTAAEHHNDAKRTKETKDTKTARETVAERKRADAATDTKKKDIGNSPTNEKDLGSKPKELSANKPSEASELSLSHSVGEAQQEYSRDASSEVSVGIVVNEVAPQTNTVIGSELTESSPSTDAVLLAAAETETGQDSSASNQASSLVNSALETPVWGDNAAPEIASIANMPQKPDSSATMAQGGDQISEPAAPNRSLSDENLTQPLAAPSFALSTNQPINPATPVEAQALGAEALASVSSLKSIQSQAAVAQVSEISGEAEEGLSSSVTGDAVFAKAMSAVNAGVSGHRVTPEAVNGGGETLAPMPNSNSSVSAQNSAMDSLMRGADPQTPAARSFVVQTSVPTPVGQPQWSQAVGEKVLWLAAQNVTSAEINLHPKDLGPMQVRVSVNQEQATVSFTSHHAVVREVLDQNLNRLRDMFSEQGLNLVNVDVSDKSFSRQQGDSQNQKGQSGTQGVVAEEETPIAMTTIVQQRLVDHYA